MSRRVPRRRPGRPTALTAEVEKRILDLLKIGVPATHAARAAGISERAFFAWVARGEEAVETLDAGREVPDTEQPFLQFVQATTRARSEGMTRAVAHVQKAAAGGYVVRETTRRYRDADGRLVTETDKVYAPPEWRAAAWWLERADRQHFGRGASELQLTGPGGGPVEVSTADYEGLATRLRVNMQRVGAELPPGGAVFDGEVVERAS